MDYFSYYAKSLDIAQTGGKDYVQLKLQVMGYIGVVHVVLGKARSMYSLKFLKLKHQLIFIIFHQFDPQILKVPVHVW